MVQWIKGTMNIDSPVEIITFSVYMLAFHYGTIYAFIMLFSDVIGLIITARFKLHKSQTLIYLFFISLIGKSLRFFPMVLGGIFILLIRYLVDFIINFLILRKGGDYLRKIPQKVINIIFWVIFYLRFGIIISNLMT